MLISDRQQQQQERRRRDSTAADLAAPSGSQRTRFSHLEIPIHESGSGGDGDEGAVFGKCVSGLLSVVMLDVHVQLIFPPGEITAVYSVAGDAGAAAGDVQGMGNRSLIRLGNMYAGEEREILVELRLPASSSSSSAMAGGDLAAVSVRCSYRDPVGSQDLVIRTGEKSIPLPPALDCHRHRRPAISISGNGGGADKEEDEEKRRRQALRLRDKFVTTRAVAESRRLAELGDYETAVHLLSSARSLLLQPAGDGAGAGDEDLDRQIRRLESDLGSYVQHLRRQQQNQHPHRSPDIRRRGEEAAPPSAAGGNAVAGEQLTPTSAWRAAERLAKLAVMRKSQNRVSDLHGFENARF